ncbi:MAG: glucose-6-phosphate isomerase [Proteobacteria bacterium]|nr:glucose-6-phosphate isomerase [Pseudomonadota bacterium]
MRYQHLTDNCLATGIGEDGLTDEAFARVLLAAAPAHDRLCQLLGSGRLPCLSVVGLDDDLAPARALAEDWRARLDDVVVLGTGGSSLGGRTLYALSDRGFGPQGGGPRLHFLDNVDPDSMSALLGALDLSRSGIIAISKSGATAETLAQVLVLLPALEEAVGRARLADHMAVVTEPGPSPLREIATRYGLPCFDHDPEIGGRFSVFSVVGALPAMIAGLDFAALRRGAGEVLRATLDAKRVEESVPAIGAAIAIGLLQERQLTQSVLITYEDRLAPLGLWYRQLWAESLGKDGTGTTPIRARGTVDHHSQLQLYLAGPRDKMFTLVMPGTAGGGAAMSAPLAEAAGARGLAGRTLGDLLDAAARATAETLARNGRPVRLIRLEAVDEAALGAVQMHFMIETIIAADLLGVNAFDQPAVEAGKALTWQYLNQAGQ